MSSARRIAAAPAPAWSREAAEERGLDAATVACGQLVVNCVNCHQDVRLQPEGDFKP